MFKELVQKAIKALSKGEQFFRKLNKIPSENDFTVTEQQINRVLDAANSVYVEDGVSYSYMEENPRIIDVDHSSISRLKNISEGDPVIRGIREKNIYAKTIPNDNELFCYFVLANEGMPQLLTIMPGDQRSRENWALLMMTYQAVQEAATNHYRSWLWYTNLYIQGNAWLALKRWWKKSIRVSPRQQEQEVISVAPRQRTSAMEVLVVVFLYI